MLQTEQDNKISVLEKDQQDFDTMLELKLEKQRKIEEQLRKSLQVCLDYNYTC